MIKYIKLININGIKEISKVTKSIALVLLKSFFMNIGIIITMESIIEWRVT